jgi:acyl-CoA dehydrogenase
MNARDTTREASSAAIQHIDDASFDEFLGTIERFVNDELVPEEPRLEETHTLAPHIVERMRELGLFGMSIAPEFGGLGLTMTQQVRLHMSLAVAAQGFRYAYGTNVGIGSRSLSIAGTEAQRERYLPGLASGELLSAFCATEADSGSDLASLKTQAVRDGNHYVLNGNKRFITSADVAHVFTVLARTSGDGGRGISAFIVERDTPGISIGKPEKKLGQHGGNVCDVHFDNVRVPQEALIGGVEGRGFSIAMRTLDGGRLSVAANSVGQMRRAIDEAGRYARERRQFGKPIAEFQLVQALLADSETDWFVARSAVLDAARAVDAGTATPKSAACAKYFASEALGRVADRCLQVFGGSGYIADYPLERIFRDARVSRIYEGTSQIMQLVIAKELLKELA